MKRMVRMKHVPKNAVETSAKKRLFKAPKIDSKELFLRAWILFYPDLPQPFEEVKSGKYRIDYGFIPERTSGCKAFVGIEVDGAVNKMRGKDIESLFDRHDELTAVGWRLFHFSPQQLKADPFRCCLMVKIAAFNQVMPLGSSVEQAIQQTERLSPKRRSSSLRQ